MNKYVRCLWIVDTLNNYGKCTLKELNDRWINSTLNDEGEEILPRTFFRDKEFIYGPTLSLEKDGLRIFNIKVNGESLCAFPIIVFIPQPF